MRYILGRLILHSWLKCNHLLTILASASAMAQSTFLITPLATSCGGESNNSGAVFGPLGLADDRLGNLYITDKNRAICRVTPNGDVQIVATGVGNSGSNTFQSSALAVDRTGNIFFSESYGISPIRNQPVPPDRVKMISPSGSISEVHDTAASALAVDAVGNLYIGTSNRIIRRTPQGVKTPFAGGITGYSGDGGQATSAALTDVRAIAFDSLGNLYFVDNTRIRKISPSGVITSILAQAGPLRGLAIDLAGNAYYGVGSLMKRLSPLGSEVTIAGGGAEEGFGGLATSVRLDSIYSLVVDPSGSVAFVGQNTARRIIPAPAPSGACQYRASPSSVYVNPEGGSGSFQILTSAPDCPWLSSRLDSWARSNQSGIVVGNGGVTFQVDRNSAGTGRSAIIWAAGQNLTINQGGSECELTFRRDVVSLPAQGGPANIAVVSNLQDCSWTATTTTAIPWVFLSSTTTGVGSGTLAIALAANDGTTLRSGAITFKGFQGSRQYSATVTLRQAPRGTTVPTFATAGVTNAASGSSGAISPGGFVALYGLGLGPTQGALSGIAVQGLAGTKVLVNGQEAYLTYSSSSQVNFLVPSSLNESPATIEVEYQLLRNVPVTLAVLPAQPGIFTADGSGLGDAVVVNENGTLNSKSNPAPVGSIVAFWFTGQGQTLPPLSEGQQPSPGQYPKPVLPLTVEIGGTNVGADDILFVGLVYPGVTQVNVRIPTTAKSGSAALLVRFGGAASKLGVILTVE